MVWGDLSDRGLSIGLYVTMMSPPHPPPTVSLGQTSHAKWRNGLFVRSVHNFHVPPPTVSLGQTSCTTWSASWRSGSRSWKPSPSRCPSRSWLRRNAASSATSLSAQRRWSCQGSSFCLRYRTVSGTGQPAHGAVVLPVFSFGSLEEFTPLPSRPHLQSPHHPRPHLPTNEFVQIACIPLGS